MLDQFLELTLRISIRCLGSCRGAVRLVHSKFFDFCDIRVDHLLISRFVAGGDRFGLTLVRAKHCKQRQNILDGASRNIVDYYMIL